MCLRTDWLFAATILVGLMWPGSADAQLLEVSFDGNAAPGAIYQGSTCTPLADGAAGTPCVRFVEGRRGQALEFGKSTVVAAPVNIDPRQHPQLTISAWIKRPASGGNGGNIFSSGGYGGLPDLSLYGGQLAARAGGKGIRYVEGLVEPPRNTWVLVAGVWDYDARTLRLHVGDSSVTFAGLPMDLGEGSLDVIRPHPTWIAPDGSGGAERHYVFIGGQNFKYYAQSAKGIAIDDVRIHARALSEQEIATLASGGEVASDPVQTASGGSSPYPVGQAPPTGGVSALEDSMDEYALPPSEAVATGAVEDDDASAQAQTPGETSAPAAGMPRPVGDPQYTGISGFPGQNKKTLELTGSFLRFIGWYDMAITDKPCGIRIDSVSKGEGSYKFLDFQCNTGIFKPAVRSSYNHHVSMGEDVVASIKVCNGASSHRLKGLYVAGQKINADGTTGFSPVSDEESLPRCARWGTFQLCPGNTVATGLVVHSDDAGGDTEVITGLQLICRRIGLE